MVDPDRARALFAEALPRLFRYPAIDETALRDAIDRMLGNDVDR